MEELNLEELVEKANNGDSDCQTILGVMYKDGNKVEQSKELAIEWFNKALESNNVYALYNLGMVYEEDDNSDEALNYYKKAANLGFDLAIFKSIELISEKFGKESAFGFTKKLAEKGYDEAQFRLGTFYFLGIATKKNYDEALDSFIKAANQGSVRGLEMATVCVYNGYGTDKDIKLAKSYAEEILEVYFEDPDEILLPEFIDVCKKLELDTTRKN